MPIISLPHPDDDNSGEHDGELVEVPANWAICGHCEGEGKSSAWLGSFTQEQMAEDPDFAQDYMSGVYDKTCRECRGSGKVMVPALERCNDLQMRAVAHQGDLAQSRYEAFLERKRESLMLGESRLEDWDGIEPD